MSWNDQSTIAPACPQINSNDFVSPDIRFSATTYALSGTYSPTDWHQRNWLLITRPFLGEQSVVNGVSSHKRTNAIPFSFRRLPYKHLRGGKGKKKTKTCQSWPHTKNINAAIRLTGSLLRNLYCARTSQRLLSKTTDAGRTVIFFHSFLIGQSPRIAPHQIGQ